MVAPAARASTTRFPRRPLNPTGPARRTGTARARSTGFSARVLWLCSKRGAARARGGSRACGRLGPCTPRAGARARLATRRVPATQRDAQRARGRGTRHDKAYCAAHTNTPGLSRDHARSLEITARSRAAAAAILFPGPPPGPPPRPAGVSRANVARRAKRRGACKQFARPASDEFAPRRANVFARPPPCTSSSLARRLHGACTFAVQKSGDLCNWESGPKCVLTLCTTFFQKKRAKWPCLHGLCTPVVSSVVRKNQPDETSRLPQFLQKIKF